MSTNLQNCVSGIGGFTEPPKPNHGPYGDGERLMSRGSGEVHRADLLVNRPTVVGSTEDDSGQTAGQ